MKTKTFESSSKTNDTSNNTWDDLWEEFILDCQKANKKKIEASDFFFWLDFGFKVPDKL